MNTLSQRRYVPVDRASALPPIKLERIATDDNTDTLTQATVQKMCALIREAATDPLVQQCAAYAKKRFACGSSDPAALAWGVFWYVKHCVKFRSDEGTMLQIGEQALDTLISPAVLVRMDKPSEDCDGFTMLSAAMLTILGVPVLPTTVATDLDDKQRWSHVFLCALVNGRVMPLDTSHGKAPGWMVPRDRINRFQTWTLDGRPADVKIPNYQGLHGYVPSGLGMNRRGARVIPVPRLRGRGFGQTDTFIEDPGAWIDTTIGAPLATDFTGLKSAISNYVGGGGGAVAPGDIISTLTGSSASVSFPFLDPTSASQAAAAVQAPAGYTGPTVLKPTAATPAAPSGYQWAQIINSSGNQLAKILTVASGGSSQTLANGNQILMGAGGGNIMGSLSSSTGISSTMLIIGGVGLLALFLLKK